jgi:hypothetical protein
MTSSQPSGTSLAAPARLPVARWLWLPLAGKREKRWEPAFHSEAFPR